MKKIYLVGNPNVGKTVVFNNLTNSKEKTGNFSGTTILEKKAYFKTNDNIKIEIFDLAGIYLQKGKKEEESLAWKKIEYAMKEENSIFVQIINPSQLKQSLSLTLELQKKGIQPILFFNTKNSDIEIQTNIYENIKNQLGVIIFSCDGISDDLKIKFQELILLKTENYQKNKTIFFRTEETKQLFINKILENKKSKKSTVSNFLDEIFLNPIFGVGMFLCIIWVVFELTFTVGSIPMDYIDIGIALLMNYLKSIFGEGFLASIFIDGLISGVGATIIFLPNILILFFFLAILKESGYLSRTSYLFDKIFKYLGTSGKASVHLLMGFGCNVPSVMAVKQFETKKEKIIVSMMTLFMSCGARLPVYTLLISAFIPQKFQGLTLWSIYLFGVLIALFTGFFINKSYKQNIKPKSIIYEMPNLVLPSLKHSVQFAFDQGKIFIFRVGKIIVPAAIIIWMIFAFPSNEVEKKGIEASYGAGISKFITPIFEPIGFDWKITAGVISGIAAKEVMVTTFAEVFESEDFEDETVIGSTLQNSGSFSLGIALSLLFFTLLYTPCMAVLGVLKEELGYKWMVFGAIYPAIVGWIVGFILYRLF
jgi:ferrous iron transport protein B